MITITLNANSQQVRVANLLVNNRRWLTNEELIAGNYWTVNHLASLISKLRQKGMEIENNNGRWKLRNREKLKVVTIGKNESRRIVGVPNCKTTNQDLLKKVGF